MIAALFVATDGCYFGLDGVDPWDEKRDARLYAGPWPVVAHPPCDRWCMPLAVINQTRYGHRVGDDGGCFSSALDSVRRWGGVLEHPANSAAFRAHDLPKPCGRAWLRSFCGGWTCEVAQVAYGHPAEKRTWLYAFGVTPPQLRWSGGVATHLVSQLNTTSDLPRLSKREAKATPPAFRDMLLAIARSVNDEAPNAGALRASELAGCTPTSSAGETDTTPPTG